MRNEDGKEIVLSRNSEISILDAKGRELEKYEVPTGADLLVEENQEVKAGDCALPMGPAQYSDFGRSLRQGALRGRGRRRDDARGEGPGGTIRRLIMDHKGELHPQIVLEDADGKPLDVYYLPERAHIEVGRR